MYFAEYFTQRQKIARDNREWSHSFFNGLWNKIGPDDDSSSAEEKNQTTRRNKKNKFGVFF
jgi:hypothetical protein